MDIRLKEVSLDCIMAFGKICICLNFNYTRNKPNVTTAVQANKTQKEMQELKEQQEILTEYLDQLQSSQVLKNLDQSVFGERVARIIRNMREIEIDMA
jgi:ribosome assembly protein YihI (activator of Der GTPase)